MKVRNRIVKIMLLAFLLGMVVGCTTSKSGLLNTLSSPFQSTTYQPTVPEVKLDFALPNDFRKEPIKLKSVGMTDNCDLSGTCASAPPARNSNTLFLKDPAK